MLRLLMLVALLALAVIEYKKPLKPFVFPSVFSLFTLIFALRCGQGTDYFSYCQIYTDPAAAGQAYEIGYTFLNDLARGLGLPFTVFVFIYSLIVMGLLCLLLYKACSNKFMGLFVVYALYYLQFFESSFRQVLAMMLVLLGYWLTASKNRIWYALIGTAIAFTLHTSAIVSILFLLPYAAEKCKKCKAYMGKHPVVIALITGLLCTGLIVFSCSPLFYALIEALPVSVASRIANYIENNTYSIMSLLSRIVFLGLIVILYVGARSKISRAERIFFHTYILGFIIYCALFRFDLIASRMNAYYKITEIVLIPNLLSHFSPADLKLPVFLKENRWLKPGLLVGTAVLLSFMYLKTTKDVMNQSLYYEQGYLYPYYNVFTVEKMYTQRHAPNYAHREFYALLDKKNPRLIGVEDTLAKNYIAPVLLPSNWKALDFHETVTEYLLYDPATVRGSLISLLNESGTKIYDQENKADIPTATPKAKMPITIKDLKK